RHHPSSPDAAMSDLPRVCRQFVTSWKIADARILLQAPRNCSDLPQNSGILRASVKDRWVFTLQTDQSAM
ncbi:MAG: hypothetical protein J0G94_00315, partial [Sphingomonadales bacterium]|nr:hypothetical protein [Sphingomonadales bacterium]